MKVKLLPRKEFELQYDDKVIKGQFGTWSMKRFCDLRGYALSDVSNAFKGNGALDDIVCFLLSAVECSARLNGEDFNYTDVHACNWIDRMGGIEAPEFVNLFNHSASDLKKKVTTKEKV